MRMQSDEAMPALSMIEELGGVDAVFVTHAHADHIGALPVAHLLCPDAPVYTTPPTIDLMRIMMQDSYRILEARSQIEHTLIPYTEAQMTSLLESTYGNRVHVDRHLEEKRLAEHVAEVVAGGGVTKNPSIHTDQGEVRVKLPAGAQVSASEQNNIHQEVEKKTGYTLESVEDKLW